MADADGHRHIGLISQCGVCAGLIRGHEMVIALSGNDDSTAYRGHTEPFPFPRRDHIGPRVDGLPLCCVADCKPCAASPEYVPVHCDCYLIFCESCAVKGDDALRRLWTLAAWTRSWRGAQPIRLWQPELDRDALETAAQVGGLPLLPTLPTELVDLVRRQCRHALLWRCVAAISLAARVSATVAEPLVTLPLRDVLSWERDGKLERMASTSPSSPPSPSSSASSMPADAILRLTIASDGISKVERLADPPHYRAECSTSSAFVLLDAAAADGIVAQFKDGRLRLQLAPGRLAFPVWNTPAPPDLSLCYAYLTAASCSWQRFHVIEMDRVQGVTFFFLYGRMHGIHVHRPGDSCAVATYDGFLHLYRREMLWIYLPIAKADRLLVLGIREQVYRTVSVLARTQLAGEITMGQPCVAGQASTSRCLGRAAPMTLVYREARAGFSVPFFGAFSTRYPDDDAPLPPPFALVQPSLNPLGSDAYFSSAPLAGVVSTLAFSDPETGFCRGILFRYRNGGARTVGQCRVHVDPTRRVDAPRMLCFQNEVVHTERQWAVHRARVDFEHGPEHGQDKEWECHALEGTVEFWFTEDLSSVSVVK